MPAIVQRQVSVVLTLLTPLETSQLLILDKVPTGQTVLKPSRIRCLPVQSPQVQSFRKVVGMPGC